MYFSFIYSLSFFNTSVFVVVVTPLQKKPFRSTPIFQLLLLQQPTHDAATAAAVVVVVVVVVVLVLCIKMFSLNMHFTLSASSGWMD